MSWALKFAKGGTQIFKAAQMSRPEAKQMKKTIKTQM